MCSFELILTGNFKQNVNKMMNDDVCVIRNLLCYIMFCRDPTTILIDVYNTKVF